MSCVECSVSSLELCNRMLEEYQQHKGPVRAVKFSTDGAVLYSAGADGNLCAYDALQGYTPVKLISSDLPDESYVNSLLEHSV